MTNKGWSIQLSPGSMTPCNCVGPQRGEPYCPCMAKADEQLAIRRAFDRMS